MISRAVLLLLIAVAVCFSFVCESPAFANPRIRVEKSQYNFGVLEEGVEVTCNFIIHNDGTTPLIIKEAKATCGCTVPALKDKVIAPHSAKPLTVVMDTSMKQGVVKKLITVKSNDSKHPLTKLYVIADVQNPHAQLGKNIQAKIFQGRCAACHVQEGVGKEGEDLYRADCAMCHGFGAKGTVGPGLLNFDYENKAVAGMLRQVIAEGSRTHRSMPGFSKKRGGPLTEAEIDSLITFLKWRAKLEKSRPAKKP